MKIDVEGFEYEVLLGGKDTIKRNMPNIYIEIEQKHHKSNNINHVFEQSWLMVFWHLRL